MNYVPLENGITQLHVVIAKKLWNCFRKENLENWGFDTYDELLSEVAKHELNSEIGCYWASRVMADKPIGPGNLKFVNVVYECDLSKVLVPGMKVTEDALCQE